MSQNLAERVRNEHDPAENLAEILVRYAADFINAPPQDMNPALDRLLSMVGLFAVVDRVYIFQHDHSRQVAVITHEWCAPGITPRDAGLQAVPFELIPEIMKCCSTREVIYVPCVSQIRDKPELRAHLEGQGIKSMVVASMFSDEINIGFVGLDSVKKERVYTENEIYLVKFLAEIVSGSMARNPSEGISQEHNANGVFKEAIDSDQYHGDLCHRLEAAERRLAADQARLCGLMGSSPVMLDVYRQIRLAARNSSIVFIQGETGTGKEVAARAIHELTGRKEFIAVNCANLSPNLLESELFGHKKGSFTGAVSNKKGLFQEAGDGVILLDEIETAPSQMQTALLRVLDRREVTRVGDSRPIKIDAKIIVASNQDLEEMMEKGQFRDDLFFRLCETVIRLPPLRERSGDILTLADFFFREFSSEDNALPRKLSLRCRELFLQYSWPGNVRELRNMVRLLADSASSRIIRPADLPPVISNEKKAFPGLRKREKQAVQEAMELAMGNKTRAAELLGVTRKTIYTLLDRHGLG